MIQTAPSEIAGRFPRSWWRDQSSGLFFFEHVVLAQAWEDKFRNFGCLHQLLCDFLDRRKRPSRRKFISVFRGSYKTTVLLGFIIWVFAWSIEMNKPASITYNTSIKENAEALNLDFRETVEHCLLLKWIFPKLPTDPNDFRKWEKHKVEYRNLFRFQVSSTETQQTSRHTTIYINDDIVNDLNSKSEGEREKVWDTWKYQKSIVTRYAKFKIGLEIDSGTPFHSKDTICKIRKLPSYDKFIVPWALEDGRGRVDPYKENGVLSFPEMFCWEDFRTIREDQGPTIFATQYALEIADEEGMLCRPQWIRKWVRLPEVYKRVMVMDPAVTADPKRSRTSATGVVICDVDPSGNLYVIFAEKFFVTPEGFIRLMERLTAQFHPDETYVEKEKTSITIADTYTYLAPKLNFTFVEHQGRPKASRIMYMQQWFETGRILLGDNMNELEDAIVTYDGVSKENTDLLDPLAYQVKIIDPPKRGHRRDEREEKKDRFEEELERVSKLMKNLQSNTEWGQADATM